MLKEFWQLQDAALVVREKIPVYSLLLLWLLFYVFYCQIRQSILLNNKALQCRQLKLLCGRLETVILYCCRRCYCYCFFRTCLLLHLGHLFLMRIDRKTWVIGQVVYVIGATFLFLLFILTATSLVCMTQSFVGNMWSETAAMLAYSEAGKTIALPALVKTLELSTPYAAMATIFLLMLMYTLLMVLIMMVFNLYKGHLAGMVSVFAFSLFGFCSILKP